MQSWSFASRAVSQLFNVDQTTLASTICSQCVNFLMDLTLQFVGQRAHFLAMLRPIKGLLQDCLCFFRIEHALHTILKVVWTHDPKDCVCIMWCPEPQSRYIYAQTSYSQQSVTIQEPGLLLFSKAKISQQPTG